MVLFVDKLEIFCNILTFVVESNPVINETKLYQSYGLVRKKKSYHSCTTNNAIGSFLLSFGKTPFYQLVMKSIRTLSSLC